MQQVIEEKPRSAKIRVSSQHSQSSKTLQVKQQKFTEGGNLFLLKNRKAEKAQISHQTLQDRETLYDENLRLKQDYNKIFEENKLLRANYKHLEKDVMKYESIIEERRLKLKDKKKQLRRSFERPDEAEPQAVLQSQVPKEAALVILQKKTIKELQKDSQDKDKIIETYKRDIRYTRLQESQTELKHHQDECQRLRAILQSKLQQETLSRVDSSVDLTLVYKNDNILLSTMLKKIENDYIQLKLKHKDLEQEHQKLWSKKSILEKLSSDKDKEVIKLKSESTNPGKKILKDVEKEYKDHLDQKDVEIMYLKGQIDVQRQKIILLEKRQREFATDKVAQAGLETKEKLTLTNQYNELRKQSDELYSQLIQCQSIMADNGIKIQNEEFQLESIASSPKSPKKKGSVFVTGAGQAKIAAVRRRVPKVNHYDVESLGGELRLKMKIQGILFSDLDQLLVPHIFDDDVSIKITNLTETLQKSPFSIRNEDDALLIARYLVEENQEDWIIYDENRANTVKIIRSVFKNLIKSYDLFSLQEAQETRQELSMMMTKYKGGMRDAIKQLILKKTQLLEPDFCELQDLMEAFRFCDIILTARQQEFLTIRIYELNKSQSILNYVQLFQQFDTYSSLITTSPDYINEGFESLTLSKPISEFFGSSYPDVIEEDDEYK